MTDQRIGRVSFNRLRIGKCSNCGGEVHAHADGSAHCQDCHWEVPPVIKMRPRAMMNGFPDDFNLRIQDFPGA